jgi:hypothetical protein
MDTHAKLEKSVGDLRKLFPQLSVEEATDLLLRHDLNFQAAINEYLEKESKSKTQTISPIATSKPQDTTLIDIFGFDPTPKAAPVTPVKATSPQTDLMDLFGDLAIAKPANGTPPVDNKQSITPIVREKKKAFYRYCLVFFGPF